MEFKIYFLALIFQKHGKLYAGICALDGLLFNRPLPVTQKNTRPRPGVLI